MHNPQTHESCHPIIGLPSEVRSLTFLISRHAWIAVFSSRQKLPGDNKPVPGFYYSTSTDLFSWSRLQRIIPASTKAREEQLEEVLSYPSLLDPQSTSMNFDTISSEDPILLFTLQHLSKINGYGTMNRDLDFIPVSIK